MIAALVIAGAAILVLWALLERRGRQTATERAAKAAARAVLDRRRVRVEADRREAAEVADAVRAAAVETATDEHATTTAELESKQAEIDGATTASAAAEALRRAFDG